MVSRYAAYARDCPDRVACSDWTASLTWAELDAITDTIAARLVALSIPRDGRVLVQIPSSNREMVLRIAFKKAGILGCFAPMQWRQRELEFTIEQLAPNALVVSLESMDGETRDWLQDYAHRTSEIDHLIGMSSQPPDGWLSWSDLESDHDSPLEWAQLAARRFRFDEVSLITASSGTSSLAKLNEWPEAAQLCIGRGIAERLAMRDTDIVGMFAPMAGAAGVLVWVTSATLPLRYVFPKSFDADSLLRLVAAQRITVATTVPVVLARLAQAGLEAHDVSSLRALRVGTGAASLEAASVLEDRIACKVVVASGAMECPGFGHAAYDEPAQLRLDGSTGLPLPGCCVEVVDDDGAVLAPGAIGQTRVRAPFASLGYWNDPQATQAVWSEGWYATGDLGSVDEAGRLTLLGRLKEVINRSGHKVLPAEVERVVGKHPDVFQCAVVGASDREYGEVPWLFVQSRAGRELAADDLFTFLRGEGLASYKWPARVVTVDEFPRVGGNKIDKKRLLGLAGAP